MIINKIKVFYKLDQGIKIRALQLPQLRLLSSPWLTDHIG